MAMHLVVDADDTLWFDGIHFEHLRARIVECFVGASAATEREVLENLSRCVEFEQPGETGFVRAALKLARFFQLDSSASSALESHVEAFRSRELILLPFVADVLPKLTTSNILYTKGDPSEQTVKL